MRPRGEGVEFRMEAVPWKQVLDWLVERTGISFVGSRPTGTFTFIGPKGVRYPIATIILILNHALDKDNVGRRLVQKERGIALVYD